MPGRRASLAFDGLGVRQFGKGVAQVGVGFETVGLDSFDERTEVSRRLDAANTVAEQSDLAANDAGTDDVFGTVIVNSSLRGKAHGGERSPIGG